VMMPMVPDWWDDRPIRGEALYLRPLITAGQVMLRNQFDAKQFAVRFETEPDPISLESALYRVLGPNYTFLSIGGRADGLGMTRSWLIGGAGWARVVEAMLPRARLIVMVPSRSAGVRWEIEQMIALDALPRTVFLLPPDDGTPQMAEVIDGGRWILNDLGIGVPEHDRRGMFFQSDARRGITRTIPFNALWDGSLTRLLGPS